VKIRASSILASVIAGGVGAVVALSIGAAHFRMADPVPFSFTYQGQLRNGASLVNGTVDLRFTMWDAATGGQQIGSLIERPGVVARDGRFATELDFGASAFNGDARFVQTEVRSPAGVGQYLALQPRQQITAVPYAMYALNSGDALWRRTADAGAVYVPTGNVGIGTSNPIARFQVSGPAGDASVVLPDGAIGNQEISQTLSYVMPPLSYQVSRTVTVMIPRAGTLSVEVVVGGGSAAVSVNGAPLSLTGSHFPDGSTNPMPGSTILRGIVEVPAGPATVTVSGTSQWASAFMQCTLHAGQLQVLP
jgi:hypothetical protein